MKEAKRKVICTSFGGGDLNDTTKGGIKEKITKRRGSRQGGGEETRGEKSDNTDHPLTRL